MPSRPPGPLTTLRSFFGASARETLAILRGDPEMPPEEIVRRRAICHSNLCGEYLDYDDRCAQCGCNVEKKIAWRTASCPLAHWDAITPVIIPPKNGNSPS